MNNDQDQLGINQVVFLEKVAEMFEELSTSMPQYEQFYQICRDRASSETAPTRLVILLSYVYEDVVAFCEDVRRTLLARRTSGKHDRNSFVTKFTGSRVKLSTAFKATKLSLDAFKLEV